MLPLTAVALSKRDVFDAELSPRECGASNYDTYCKREWTTPSA